MAKHEKLLIAVREILFREWDPIGVNHIEACHNEYDSYAPMICSRLREGADVHWLATHLSHLQSDNMGMSVVDEALHKRVAQRLHALMH